MKTLVNLINRMSSWVRRPLVISGLVAGLMMGGATSASASTVFDFSYGGSGVSVIGQVEVLYNSNFGGFWNITSVSGTRTDGSGTYNISGLWEQLPNCFYCENNIAGPAYSSGYPYNTMDLHFVSNGNQYSFGYIVGFDAYFPSTEGPSANYDYADSGRCTVGTEGCVIISDVAISGPFVAPEINASAGLGALALLFGFGLILREMFLRRRETELRAI